jgi:hypothetical protein
MAAVRALRRGTCAGVSLVAHPAQKKRAGVVLVANISPEDGGRTRNLLMRRYFPVECYIVPWPRYGACRAITLVQDTLISPKRKN